MNNYVGILGLCLLVYAWIPETIHAIKTNTIAIPARFLVVYGLAGLILTVYSALQDDIIFMVLNSLATFQAFILLFVKEVYAAARPKDSI